MTKRTRVLDRSTGSVEVASFFPASSFWSLLHAENEQKAIKNWMWKAWEQGYDLVSRVRSIPSACALRVR